MASFTRFLDHTQRRTTLGRTPLDEWSAHRRDLCLTTLSTTDIHAPGGIGTHSLRRRATADLRLRPRGHWDRLFKYYKVQISASTWSRLAQNSRKLNHSNLERALTLKIPFHFSTVAIGTHRDNTTSFVVVIADLSVVTIGRPICCTSSVNSLLSRRIQSTAKSLAVNLRLALGQSWGQVLCS